MLINLNIYIYMYKSYLLNITGQTIDGEKCNSTNNYDAK